MSVILLQCCNIAAKVIKCGCDANAINGHDLGIAGTICHAFIWVTGIIVVGFLIWKLMDYVAKGIAGCYKRKCDVKDLKRKQNADIQTRLLDFQKEIAFPYEKNKDGTPEKKIYASEETKRYIKTLEVLLNITHPEN